MSNLLRTVRLLMAASLLLAMGLVSTPHASAQIGDQRVTTSSVAYWVGRQVIADMALEPAAGQTFVIDLATLESIAATEPLAELGDPSTIELLEVIDPSGAAHGQSDSPIAVSTAQAELIIAEVAIAVRMADERLPGDPGDGTGATARAQGHLLMTAAKAQADVLVLALTSDDPPASEILPSSAARSLEALSRLASAIKPGGSVSDVYEDDAFLPWFLTGAAEAHDQLPDPEALPIRGQSDAIVSLAWYMPLADDPALVANDISLRAFLLAGFLNSETSITDRAAALEGLAVAASLAPDDEATAMHEAAAAVISFIDSPDSEIDALSLATIVEGLHAYESLSATSGSTATAFADEVVSSSGLVLGLHPAAQMFDPSELVAVPDEVLAPAGVPIGPDDHPRFRQMLEQVDEGWVASGNPAGAADTLRLATALVESTVPQPIWFESAASEPGETEDPEVTTVETVEITVESTEFAFGPSVLEAPAGTEVTLILHNSGSVPHNIDIQGLGVFTEAEAGATVEITFTVPSDEGSFEFICSLPGHKEAGMVGSFAVLPSAEATTAPPAGDVALFDEAPVDPEATLIPPDGLGEGEESQSSIWIWIVGMGALAMLVVISLWALWRLALALDDPPPEPTHTPAATADKQKETANR